MTAFREMLLNAMEHGAGFDPHKVIQVTAARTARAIVFHFLDPETGLRPGGFGMLIVRQIADELVYNEKGNEVLMIKHTDRTRQ
jgi:anti-sigma regulatory factor (Ser/Thr protein kinase)